MTLDLASLVASAPLTGLAFFDAWQAARLLDKHRKPMGAVGLAQAGFVWRKWLAFCTVHGMDWIAAAPDQVRAFASTVSARKPGSRAASPITLRRYWRILNDLYAHAVLTQLIEHNPCAGVMPPVSEKTASLALPPHLWALLQESLPGGFQFKARRNRLVLLLMMRCALTVSEILHLSLASVQTHEGDADSVARHLALAGLPLLQPESPFWAPLAGHPEGLTYTLQLSGSRPVQARQLVLDARTSTALRDWLEVRRIGQTGPNDRLLMGGANGAALSPKGLYNICQAHMARSLPGIEIAQMGPNTLRNTCISVWLSHGVPLSEVLRRCGLTDAGVLTRLQRHVTPVLAL
jgi:site-specific recombinase XerC